MFFVFLFFSFLMLYVSIKFVIVGFDSAMEAKEGLNGFKVGSLPTLIYIPDFISESEQTMLLNNVKIPSFSYACLVLFSPILVCFFIRVFLHITSPMLYRFMEPLYQSGNLWRIGDYRIGVGWHFIL